MKTIHVKLQYDPTGRNPNNLISGEEHVLTERPDFPYKIFTLINGGFYADSLQVFDSNYTRLSLDRDYIVTYTYNNVFLSTGRKACGAVVLLNKDIIDPVYTNAQMVGSDVAFSLTVIPDYIDFYESQPVGYIPKSFDYSGNAPIWGEGELDEERWHLDTFQPFNNEIYYLSRAISGAVGNNEADFREYMQVEFDKFLAKFDNVLELHEQDLANPHRDTRVQIGLEVIENNPLATESQARVGISNSVYLTPSLSYATLDQQAIIPRDLHITNYNNPHRVTATQVGSMTKAATNSYAGNKYGRYDTVANANYLFSPGTPNKTYANIYTEGRNNLPAGNFVSGGANGYLPLRVLGSGFTGYRTALRSDNRWVDWTSVMATAGFVPKSSVMAMSFSGVSTLMARSIAIDQTWADDSQPGATIVMDVYDPATNTSSTSGIIKTDNGWKDI